MVMVMVVVILVVVVVCVVDHALEGEVGHMVQFGGENAQRDAELQRRGGAGRAGRAGCNAGVGGGRSPDEVGQKKLTDGQRLKGPKKTVSKNNKGRKMYKNHTKQDN